jgi:SAM-dependent MidA family methyltransferase
VTLREIIEAEIHAGGPIPFSRYMELCLYHPELGYYSRNAEQFGKAGDFYTSSDVHAVFGRLLARQFDEMWRALGRPAELRLLELGPGRGLFAQDVLDWSEKKFQEFFQALRYVLWEQSPALREKLANNLAHHLASRKAQIITPESTVSSAAAQAHIIFGNEFFDALPVEVLSSRGSLRVGIQNGRFVETWAPHSPEELEFLDRYSVHPEDDEQVEASLASIRVMKEIASSMRMGFVVLVDYGYTREEQLAGRHRGTIMAYRKHSASANPFEAPGDQDITAHVNFTALGGIATESGMKVEKLRTQSQFLMGIGEATQFADAFEECRLPQERAKVALQLKHLVTPLGMGETFHVLVGSKGIDSVKLSGLNFG